MVVGFMNKFKNKLETYAVIIQTLGNVELETVVSYKQVIAWVERICYPDI